jgi:tartrate dehydrogenase/decarboxylase/D-malate dehydrogenase
MFEHLGLARAAAALERAVTKALAVGIRPPDLGGSATTGETTAAIENALPG